MNAATISPLTLSGLATTAASTIYGCSRSTLSTSKGLMSDHDIRKHAKSSSERLGGEIIAEVA